MSWHGGDDCSVRSRHRGRGIESDWPCPDIHETTVAIMTRSSIVGYETVFHCEFTGDVDVTITSFKKHTHILDWPNAPHDSANAILAMESLKVFLESRCSVVFIIRSVANRVFTALGLSRLIALGTKRRITRLMGAWVVGAGRLEEIIRSVEVRWRCRKRMSRAVQM